MTDSVSRSVVEAVGLTIICSAVNFGSTAVLADERPEVMWMRGGHSAPIASLAYSPDGDYLVTGSDDWTAKIWRVSDRQLVRTLIPYVAGCSAVAFSPDGKWLAVGTDAEGGDDTSALKVYETRGFTEVFSQIQGDDGLAGISALAFSDDSTLMAVAGPGFIRLFDTENWMPAPTITLPGEDVRFTGVALSRDGSKLVATAVIDDDRTLLLWNLNDGGVVWSRIIGDFSGFRYSDSVVFSPSGDEILCGVSGSLQVRRTTDGNVERLLEATNVLSIAFAPDGRTLALSSWLDVDSVQVWNWPAGTLRYRILNSWPYEVVTFSPEGQTLAGAGGYYFPGGDGGVRVWRSADGQRQRGFDEHAGKIERVVFSPDNSLVVSGGSDGTVRLWETATGNPVAILRHNIVTTALAFSPDSSLVVTSGANDFVRVWSVNGTLVRQLNYPFGRVDEAAFSPDGKHVGVAYGSLTVVFDVETGNPTANGPAPESFQLRRFGVVSLNGSATAWYSSCCPVCTPGTCGLMLNGQTLEATPVNDVTPRAMSFAADSGTLLVAGSDPSLKFWGTTSREIVLSHTNEVAGGAPFLIRDGNDRVKGMWRGATAVAYSSDGQYFAYGRVDGTIALARNLWTAPVRLTAKLEGGAIRLNWQGGNRFYQLQRKGNLSGETWETIFPQTAATTALLITGESSAGFYRVVQLGN